MRPRRMMCGPRPQMVSPAQQKMYPPKQCVKHNYFQQEVDHIHPTHTTNCNHLNVVNKHYFPQTQSNVNSVSEQNVNMGPTSPQMMGPGQMGPGMGPGQMGPGGQVAGASTGPMGGPGMMGPGHMGPGSQVAGASTGPMGGPGMMGPGQMGPMGMKKGCGC